MPVKPTDAKKLAEEFNTTDLRQLIQASDELMRIVLEAGDEDTALNAAQVSAEMEAALIVRKEGGVRELAKRVRDRVSVEAETPDAPASDDSQS